MLHDRLLWLLLATKFCCTISDHLSSAAWQAALEAAEAAAERAAKNAAKHQAAVAQLTGDNLVLMLRVRAAEEEAAAGRKEREDMRAALDEQRGPWFDEVSFDCLQPGAAWLIRATNI